MNYNVTIPEYTEFEKDLQQEQDFFNYMRMLKEALPNYALFIAAADTPSGPLFTRQHSDCMRDALGLKIDMTNAFRQPYIAIIDGGEILYEETSKDVTKPLRISADFGNHSISILSGGYSCDTECWPEARITIDDISYYCIRGFVFLLYNMEKDYVADYSRFETFDDGGKNNFHKRLAYSQDIISALCAGGGVLCPYELPFFADSNNRSKQENFINKLDFKFGRMQNENELKHIWNNKLFDFCNDFNTMEDLKETITTPESYEDINGVRKFKNHSSKLVNTRNGMRVTTGQPSKHKRAIFLIGGCTTFGVGAEDSKTISSYLQRKLNEYAPEEEFIVYNYGYFIEREYAEELLPVIKSLPIKENDIVFFQRFPPLYGLPYCDLGLKANRPHEYGEVFLDRTHYSSNGNKLIADEFFNFLKERNFFKNVKMEIIDYNKTKIESDKLLREYKEELNNFYKENIQPKVGAIVMNANPFTYGHRYLVEAALKECDYLIVFVVEEDKSELSFEDRFSLVKENLSDLKRVFVRKSGEFIISAKTFSEYFRKESLQDQKIDTTLDVTLFAKEIAPVLNISVRFAGKEPTDSVTRQYNEDMARILPQYGINFIELERAKNDNGEIISASTVRSLTKSGEFDRLKEFAPPATVRYLTKKFA